MTQPNKVPKEMCTRCGSEVLVPCRAFDRQQWVEQFCPNWKKTDEARAALKENANAE